MSSEVGTEVAWPAGPDSGRGRGRGRGRRSTTGPDASGAAHRSRCRPLDGIPTVSAARVRVVAEAGRGVPVDSGIVPARRRSPTAAHTGMVGSCGGHGEPGDSAIVRPKGRLTNEIHPVRDGHGRLRSLVPTPAAISTTAPRSPPSWLNGVPTAGPAHAVADKASRPRHSAPTCATRGIPATIPEHGAGRPANGAAAEPSNTHRPSIASHCLQRSASKAGGRPPREPSVARRAIRPLRSRQVKVTRRVRRACPADLCE